MRLFHVSVVHRNIYRHVKKAAARLRELAPAARGGQNSRSHNLAFAFFDMSVLRSNSNSKGTFLQPPFCSLPLAADGATDRRESSERGLVDGSKVRRCCRLADGRIRSATIAFRWVK